MTTIRDKGIVTIAIERDIKERIKQLAGDTDIYVFVRDMVNDYAKDKQIPITGVGKSKPSIDQRLDKMDDQINTMSVMLAGLFVHNQKELISGPTELLARIDVVLENPSLIFKPAELTRKAFEKMARDKLSDAKLEARIEQFSDMIKEHLQPSLFTDNIESDKPVA